MPDGLIESVKRVLAGVAYAGIGCSFAAYTLWTKAIGSIGPVLAGIVYYFLPVVTAVESVWLLGGWKLTQSVSCASGARR